MHHDERQQIRLLSPDFDAGLVSFAEAAALSPFSPGELADLAWGRPPLIRCHDIGGVFLLDLADLLALSIAATPLPPQEAPECP